MPGHAVRLARRDDVPAVAAALTRAFLDDPFACWMFPREGTRRRRLPRLYRARLGTLLAHELTWTTDDRSGAALWAPPDAWRVPVEETLRNLSAYLTWRTPMLLAGWHQVEQRHPTRPHLYLAILGVEPSVQGRGVGARLLAPGLERCDREGIPAYLESSKASNIPFYERHGFRVTDEIVMPRGPRGWLMWRDAR